MHIWDSESIQPKHTDVLEKDHFYLKLDDNNGLLRLADYHLNESRATSILFIGPDSEANAHKWDQFAHKHPDEIDEDEHEVALKACFNLA